MVLIILILPMLVLLFQFFLSHVLEIIKLASFKSTLSCFNLFLVLLVILFRTFDPKVDGPSTNKVVENDQNLDVEGVNDESHFYDSVDWLMRDEEIDCSKYDIKRTPKPPIHGIVNSCKLDPQVSDATAKITSSDDHRIKRKRRQYRPKVKNISHATPIPPAPPPPRAPSPAQAPAPARELEPEQLELELELKRNEHLRGRELALRIKDCEKERRDVKEYKEKIKATQSRFKGSWFDNLWNM
ncbi:hypothetical protein Tco_0769171 [Tanacetum coccineum]|uniref:Uncharacterized protein n=1 Tax=Tanacetum coccineum TaxID=301880 RepID=A0ABQ4Z8Z4_9ASTR